MSGFRLSIVSPLLNEVDNLEPLYQELLEAIRKLKYFTSYEIIFVNDGSSDNSFAILKQLAARDAQVKIISFTRNFGHEYATHAGLVHATGDAVVLIDADRQDPPELIVSFEQAFLDGYHIVYGQRSKRLNETVVKKLTSKAFYPVFTLLTGIDLPHDVGDFCLLSRKAVDCFKQMPERALFVRGLIYWSGLSKKAIPFVRRSRGAGSSKYNYSKLTIFAVENIISFSTVPIYAMLFLSLGIIVCCAIGTVIALLMYVMGRVVMTGWTSLIMCMLFLFSVTIFSLSLLGLYIGKMFHEIKQRPLYLIDEKVNL